MLALALGTLRGDLFGVVAVVAEHAAVAPVEGEGQRAVDTVDALTAGAAGDRARESATVEEEHGLLAIFKTEGNGFEHSARKSSLLASLQKLDAHVDQLHGRHGTGFHAVRQLEQRVFSALGVVAALKARRGRPEHNAGA